ncbi:kinesin-like protein KIN-7E isoform X1 [Salvia splendens]|uniref:kinesin-like protein KIN-7E isoform X1 n=1 Tax=Salvia splendens TaxID=180675 RepID=UPI001C27E4CA|nr:kinesin-like protein KIN-7E isoform X1 [Salvia splendens]
MESGGELIKGNEERILVCVRLRPLNDKEISNNDVSDWECVSSDTLVYKNVSHIASATSTYPTSYTFDRLFGNDSSTKTVYEQGAKDAAMSVVHGVNSTILAYGERSSGKTFTMTGITECAVADIYNYIQKHPEREFVVKFTAMEIYNECVRDLLSTDNAPLKLVDDPERGTVVENLTEEILRGRDHLTELMFICQALKQNGDASPNKLSLRSHQIIRLTIESSPRSNLEWDGSSTLAATLNFVDLFGTQRASQSSSTGTRSKKGRHIDQSLQTLGAVISSLSKGGEETVPYKNSKLTRILQTSLGGNARTAIICTMSPARSHIEQSRNTLHFASCAKEVLTNARVNVIVSDKALVKHLQKELARLEDEIRGSPSRVSPQNFSTLLREKDAQIEKLEKEVRDLILQRDIFESQVKDLSKMVGGTGSSITQQSGVGNYPHLRVQRSPDAYHQEKISCKLSYSDAEASDIFSRSNSECRPAKVAYVNYGNSNASPNTLPSASRYTESELFYGWHEIDNQTSSDLEDLCREVNCPDKEYCGRAENNSKFSYFQVDTRFPVGKVQVPPRIRISKEGGERDSEGVIKGEEPTSATSAKESDDHSSTETPESTVSSLRKNSLSHDQARIGFINRSMQLVRSLSCNSSHISGSPSPWFKITDYTPEKECQSCKRKMCELNSGSSSERCQSRPKGSSGMESATPARGTSRGGECAPDTKEKGNDLPTTEGENTKKTEKGKDVKDPFKLEDKFRGLTSWPVEFKRIQREIIELWNACNVALVHRTYFFMLFQGDPTDAIYLEVEIRRMKLLKDKFIQGEKVVVDGQRLSLSSSAKALRRERRMLSDQMMKRMTEKERENLFTEWGIALDTKMRRLQLANLAWSKPRDINHVNKSANLVAKLVGFLDPGQTPSKEVFGMNLTPKYSTGICTYKPSLGSLL